MNLVITGHRLFKLAAYDLPWIQAAIYETLSGFSKDVFVRGFAGMASGVDLWFCDYCRELKIPYVACIPFEGQQETMSLDEGEHREELLRYAEETKYVKNSWMVEKADVGIVVWDGNKGGTHNVLQQFVESKKPFFWINPVAKVVWRCFP